MSQGYPDFLRVSQRIGTPLVDVASDPASGAHDYGPVYVGTWPHVVLSARELTSATATVTLFWLAADDITKQLVAEQYRYTGGVDFQIVRPVVAPWVMVEVSQIAGGASEWNLSLTPTANAPTTSDSLDDPVLVDVTTTTIAAAGNDVVVGSAVRPGPAVLAVTFAAAGLFSELQSLDAAGAWHTIAQTPTSTADAKMVLAVNIPRSAVRLKTSNSGTGSQTYRATLIGQ